MFRPRLWFLIGMVLLAVALRLVPWFLGRFFGMSIDPETSTYPWNFSPLPAICLFGAAFYQDRRLSYLVPLSAYLLGDLGIGLLSGNMNFAFYSDQPFVYGSLIFMIMMGFYMRKNRSVWAIGGTSFLSALLFFLITNMGVWALGNGMRYPHSISGLIECYTMALPYFRNSLVGMMVFVPVLFSRLALVECKLPALQPVPVTMLK